MCFFRGRQHRNMDRRTTNCFHPLSIALDNRTAVLPSTGNIKSSGRLVHEFSNIQFLWIESVCVNQMAGTSFKAPTTRSQQSNNSRQQTRERKRSRVKASIETQRKEAAETVNVASKSGRETKRSFVCRLGRRRHTRDIYAYL